MIDLSALPNPYDFANPVSDADLFVGRKKEMDEIKYYLDHAKAAPRPINVALLGERAAGKTSVLNMTQIEAERRGFLAVRVDLDEDDATSHMAFFFKLFDAILATACGAGAFGGRTGKTYEAYLDMVSAYSVPEDKTFCPFSFPLQYAKAMAVGNENARVSDTTFKSDLAEMRDELNRPAVILFDEGNVLAKSQTHLEKLRNIFMNTPGFMLVLTGTPDLFPVMDEVFSPIIRQFKKVQIGRFENREETKDCIRKPLEKIGISDAEDIFDFETYRDVREIHDFTGGKPYEVQLLCHVLFRRVQQKRAKKMKLNLSVLEEARSELESTQDVSARPILNKIRGLDKDMLSALGLFCECDGHSTLEQMWAIDHIFKENSIWTKKRLEASLEVLKKAEIVDVQDGVVRFRGDDFDKIYTKYFAREKKVRIHFLSAPVDLLFHFRLIPIVEKIEGLGFSTALMLGPPPEPLETTAQRMARLEKEEDVFSEVGAVAIDLYRLMVRYAGKDKAAVVEVRFSAFGVNAKSILFSKNPAREGAIIEKCVERLSGLAERASELPADMEIQVKQIPVPPVDALVEKVERTGNEKVKEMIARDHYDEMVQAYLELHDTEKACFQADLFCRFAPSPDPKQCNNVGYIFLVAGAIDKARTYIEQSAATADGDYIASLAFYNLGVVESKEGNYPEALDAFSKSIEAARKQSPSARTCQCLIAITVAGNSLCFTEENGEVDVLRLAHQAQESVSSLAGDIQ